MSQGKGLQWTAVTILVQDKGSALDSSDHHGTRLAVDSSDHNGTVLAADISDHHGIKFAVDTSDCQDSGAVVVLLNQYMCEYSYIIDFYCIFFSSPLKVI